MVVEFIERVCQYCQLQMAARLTVRNEEQAITGERKHFTPIAISDLYGFKIRISQDIGIRRTSKGAWASPVYKSDWHKTSIINDNSYQTT